MVTAKTDEVDRVVGLELGAEDYVTKPFSPRELLLRIRTVLRRNKEQESALLGDHEIVLDRNQCRAQINGQAVDLTTTEFRLLALLFQVTGRVLSRQQLLSQVWGERARVESRTVDTHIRRLREKMGSVAHRVETVRGFGYRLAPSSSAPAEGTVYR
jgi:two-component system phosphate regulon response regulator PhoB